jgi:tripartite-type tricarboxylate transporter receptor subunit TctC
MIKLRRRDLLALAAIAVTGSGIGRASAQPAVGLKSLHIVVPTAPGTQPDIVARWLIEPMTQRAGVPGAVINRPGAAGAIAADAVLAAAPETGTLLLGGLDHVAYSHLNSQRKPLDPFVDFVPAGAVNRDTWLLVASREHPVPSLAALAELARSAGPLSYASAGEGSTAHLLTARLCKALGVEAQHVPYKESYLPDLVGGRVHFVLAPTPALLGQVRGGRVHALASLTDERLTVVEGVPSIRELGRPEQVFYGGLFLFAPASLARHAAQVNAWLVEALQRPDIAERYRQAAIEPTPLSLDQVRAMAADRLRTVDAMRLAVFGRTR